MIYVNSIVYIPFSFSVKEEPIIPYFFQISDVASGIGDSNKTLEIAEALEEAIDAEMDQSESSNTSMKAGNINASLEAIDELSEIHVNADKPPSQEEVAVKTHNISNYITMDGDIALN